MTQLCQPLGQDPNQTAICTLLHSPPKSWPHVLWHKSLWQTNNCFFSWTRSIPSPNEHAAHCQHSDIPLCPGMGTGKKTLSDSNLQELPDTDCDAETHWASLQFFRVAQTPEKKKKGFVARRIKHDQVSLFLSFYPTKKNKTKKPTHRGIGTQI